MTNVYAQFIYAPRPTSKRPQMSLENRAKIFAPFAALRGFDISILTKEKDRALVQQVTLCEQMKETLDRKLSQVQVGDQIRLTWFSPVKQIEETVLGEYITADVIVDGIDSVKRVLVAQGQEIPFDSIRDGEVSVDEWPEQT